MRKWFLLWALMILAAPYGWADELHYVNGRRQGHITVLTENINVIKYRDVNRRVASIATIRVAEITYSDAPASFHTGRRLLERGQYKLAITAFEEAATVPRVRSWIKEYVPFWIAQTYYRWAQSDTTRQQHFTTALKYYQNTIALAPDSRFLLDCHLAIGQCYYYLQQYERAYEAFGQLAAKAEELNGRQRWHVLGVLWQGKVRRAQNNLADAIRLFAQAATLASDYHNLRTLASRARIAQGECYIRQKNFQQAQQYFERLQQNAAKDDWELLAGALNGQAEVYLKQGEYYKARDLVVKVIILYPKAKEQHAKAFFLAGQCYEKLPAGHNRFCIAQAIAHYRFLTMGYPHSDWARKAKTRLQKIQ